MGMVHRNPDELHAVFREMVLGLVDDLQTLGLPFRIFEAYRTPARQRYLYKKGRWGLFKSKRIVTNAKPWNSMHQYGLAADIVLYIDGRWTWRQGFEWKVLRAKADEYGLQTLSFEQPHVQLPGVSIRELRKGNYPLHGGVSWARNMLDMIEAYKGWRTPKPPPYVGVEPAERPYLGPDGLEAPCL